jgi:hypothetical protein
MDLRRLDRILIISGTLWIGRRKSKVGYLRKAEAEDCVVILLPFGIKWEM